jgi:hypothetical protein
MLGFAVASLAIKHMSFVIVNGSIFNPIRDSLKRGFRDGVFGAETLHELFTCTLCMTTQLSIWLVGVPATMLVLFGNLGLILPLFPTDTLRVVLYALAFGTSAGFGVGGLATILMTRSEHPPQRYLALLRAHQELQARCKEGSTITISGALLNVEDLTQVFNNIDAECRGIGCPILRAHCLQNTLRSVLKSWMRLGKLTYRQAMDIIHRLDPPVQAYDNNRWQFAKDTQQRAAFIRELYKTLEDPT